MAEVSSSPPSSDNTPQEGSSGGGVAPGKIWKIGTLTYTSAGIVALFFWLLFGDFAWSIRDRSVGPMSQWYLNHIKVPNVLFGLLLTSFPAFLGLILGPIISVKSDRHRGRWGRRIPFLLVTTPMAALGMIGLAVTPIVAKWVHSHFPNESEMVVSVICFAVFWTAFELATVIGSSVFGGLLNDVVPKPLLGRFFGLFRAVSLIDGIIFNYWIIGKVPDHFTLIMAIIGVVYGVAFMWVCLKVKEGDYPPPPPAATGSLPQRASGEIKLYMRECYSHPYYLSIYVMLVFCYMSTNPVNVFSIPYAMSLEISMETYGKCLALTYVISLGLSYFIGWMVDKFHSLRMMIGTMALYGVTMVVGALFATTPSTFLACWVGHGVLSGCFFTSAASFGQQIYPHEKFAQFNSAFGCLSSIAAMTLAPLVGSLIDWTGGTYRYTFVCGAVISGIALALSLVVYRQFKRYGGPKNYVAPLSE